MKNVLLYNYIAGRQSNLVFKLIFQKKYEVENLAFAGVD